jgi:hypothetical protein
MSVIDKYIECQKKIYKMASYPNIYRRGEDIFSLFISIAQLLKQILAKI